MAPPLLNGVFLDWIDVAGNQADSFWIIKDQAPLNVGPYLPLVLAAQQMSLAGCFGVVEQRVSRINTVSSSGMYGSISDQLVMVMQTQQGRYELAIPAPKRDLFAADTVTLNNGDPRVIAFVAAAQQVLGNQLGQTYTQLFGGFRRKVTWPTTPGVIR